MVEAFAPASAAAWKPFLQSPAAVAAPEGLAFPAPFSAGRDRFAWDKPVALDLSAAVAFELELSCPLPDAMRALVLDGIQVKRPRCQEAAQQGYANATELADYLVAKGVPFREAHHIVGEAVVEAIRQGKPLEELPLSELQKFSQVIDEDVYPILSLQSCLDKRAAKGGVSPQQVAQAIAFAQARLG